MIPGGHNIDQIFGGAILSGHNIDQKFGGAIPLGTTLIRKIRNEIHLPMSGFLTLPVCCDAKESGGSDGLFPLSACSSLAKDKRLFILSRVSSAGS